MPTPSNVRTVMERLEKAHPNARYELNFSTPLELLVATILAAQCTDERVNEVTKTLFKRYRSARDYAQAKPEELEELIRSTGTYRQKAKSIQGACQALVDRFGGEVPKTMEGLTSLPGVARKSANVVLNSAWDIPSGIIVDTHVIRVSQRMGLSTNEKPELIEKDLMAVIPKDRWTRFGPALILHGRYTCMAKAPQCGECPFEDECPKLGVEVAKVKKAVVEDDDDEIVETPKVRATKKVVAPRGENMSSVTLPGDWGQVLADELSKPYFVELQRFVAEERKTQQIFPPEEEVFSALEFTPYEDVTALLLGQDPYHDDNQAHGLCFSVKPGIKAPPSLANMYKELKTDLGCKIPNHGYLEGWARQGILMINAVLTVRAHTPNSHKDKGWEQFTDAIIRKVSAKDRPVVFILWGAYAQKKAKLIDAKRHTIIQCAHPSPLSATKFFGSKPFSQVNEALVKHGHKPINWQLADR